MKNFIKYLFIFITLIGIASCGSGLNLPKDEVKPIPMNLSSTYQNQCYAKKWSNQDISILKLFNIPIDSSYNLVHLSFEDHRHIKIVAIDSTNQAKTQQWIFKGRFKRQGYFSITLYNYSFRIPFIYRQRIYDKIRIGISLENDLVIRNYTANAFYIIINGTAVNVPLGDNATYFFKPIDKTLEYSFAE